MNIKLEKFAEKKLRNEITKMGGIFYKFTSPNQAGVPDRILILKSGQVIFVEMKKHDGVISPIQKYQLKKLRSLKQKAVVVYGMNGVDNFLNFIRSGEIEKIPEELR